jgi:hypothetical protein
MAIHQQLYMSTIFDITNSITINFLPLSPLLQSEYQEPINSLLLLSPELTTLFISYLDVFILSPELNVTPSAVFDTFSNNLNFYYGEGLVQLFLFFFYIYVFIYIFLILASLK